jgi:nitrate/nitrite transporter NarK
MLRGSGVALGGGGVGTGEGIMGGAGNLGTEKCAFTSKPVKLGLFWILLKEVLRVSNANGMRNDASMRV